MGQRLNALDLAFLALETQRTPVNVAALIVLQTPAGYKGNFIRDLLDQLREQPAGPPFNLRLASGVGIPQWVEDDHFDIDYHVRHSALPRPGSMEDLLSLASRLHSRVMDRERPLWEFHLIEGLRGRRFAIYMKMHHAAIDGMGGIELLESCLSTDADAPLIAPWHGLRSRERRSSEPAPTGVFSRLTSTARGVLNQAQMGKELGQFLLGQGLKTVGLRPADAPVPFTAPKSIFNVPISGARKFAVKTIDMHDIKAVGKAAGATVNDVVLAICAGALRRYMQDKDALTKSSLLATVPVSVRQISRSGNQITYVGAKLGTDIADPIKRLRAIGQSTFQAKREVASVSPAAATSFAVMAQGLVAVLNRFRVSGFLPPPANVTISNVPGPRRTLYFAGAEMEANYPLSVLVDGQALNITVMSYRGTIDFGLMACRDTLPDVDYLAELIGESFTELRRAAKQVTTSEPEKKKTLRDARGPAKKKLRKRA